MAAEQPVSLVADGSLPDANGWYKSNIKIDNTEVEDDEPSGPYAAEGKAAFEKYSQDWPAGKVFEMSYGGAETIQDALHISYGYEEEGRSMFGLVQIDLYVNLPEPEKAYKEMAEYNVEQAKKREQPDAKWTEWPRGYPNQNDYEQVSHCGASSDGHTVCWIQNKTMVLLSTVPLAGGVLEAMPEEGRPSIAPPNLKLYADGVWQAVYAMGL